MDKEKEKEKEEKEKEEKEKGNCRESVEVNFPQDFPSTCIPGDSIVTRSSLSSFQFLKCHLWFSCAEKCNVTPVSTHP